MPENQTRLDSILLRCLVLLTIALLAQPSAAIIIRHDRDDARYVELGARFPAAVTIFPDGSGVLIAPDWVLTAGHVADGVARHFPRVEIDGREHEIARIFVHPDWPGRGPHDVALLKLRHPAEGVTPVALYSDSDEVGRVVTFVGRGDNGTGLTGPEAADRKKRGATNRIESADDDWILFDFEEGDEATDLEGVSGPGDSGGPALLTVDGKLYTLGVSVFARGEVGPGRYGVVEGYTRVSTHRDWIESIVSGQSSDREIAMGTGGAPSTVRGEGKTVAVVAGANGTTRLPDSPIGGLVRGYVEAYNSNDDSVMAAFIDANFEETFRAKRSDEEHINLYRRLYDELFGSIVLHRVVEEGDDFLAVLFESAKGTMAEFRFEAAAGAPARIGGIRVAMVDVRGGP